MVPVLDSDKTPLMPCSEKRARKLCEKGEACVFWKNGVFCIILQKEPSARNLQKITIGIDPGSKREGYTVATEKHVVLNILSNTPNKVKEKVETRRNLRRTRRSRNPPYRTCRSNRKIGRIPPSTKARWDAKIRVVNQLLKIIPLTDVCVEDVKAKPLKHAKKWNTNFSPLEVGKKYFYNMLRKFELDLHRTPGYVTAHKRDKRGFKKSSQKLKPIWEAHCVDSHILCEQVFGKINPFRGMYCINLFSFSRRQLHVQNPSKGGVRKLYGGTVSMGIPRGSLVRHEKYGMSYVGGTSKGLISLHSVLTGKRLTQDARKQELEIICKLPYRTHFLPALNRVSLRKTR